VQTFIIFIQIVLFSIKNSLKTFLIEAKAINEMGLSFREFHKIYGFTKLNRIVLRMPNERE